MVKKHIKRLSAPKSWPLGRKERTWVTKPKPGRSFDLAISLSNALKELTGVARTSKEVRYLLRNVGAQVNGSPVYDARRPVGFMDVISIPEQDRHWRIGLTKKGRLCAVEISSSDAKKRLVKVVGKTRLAGKFQINCADGTNLVVGKDQYRTGDSLLVEGSDVKKHFALSEGATIILTSGSHLSEVGTVDAIEGDTIVFSVDGEQYNTAKRCAFVVGDKEAEVTLR